jgi:hypothetical protein
MLGACDDFLPRTEPEFVADGAMVLGPALPPEVPRRPHPEPQKAA